MAKGTDVLVVGAGVIGSSIAWRLAQAGLTVVAVDPGEPGAEASSAAAGILAPQAEASGRGPFLELGLQARELYPAFAEELREATGVDIVFRRTGALELARTEEELEALSSRLNWQRAAGLPCEPVKEDEVAALEPGLSAGWRGGFLLPREAQVENRVLVQALRVALQRAGVDLRRGRVVKPRITGGRVEGVELEDGTLLESDRVVISAGAWSSGIADLGAIGRLEPVRGQMVELRAPPGTLSRVTFVSGGYLVPRADGRVVVGSTVERAGFDKRITVEGIQGLLRRAMDCVPSLSRAEICSSWAGLRPATPDGLPILGPHPSLRGVHLAMGHYRNGILLTPVTARLISESVLGSLDPAALVAFRPGRDALLGAGSS